MWLLSIFYYHFDNSGQRAAIRWLFGLTCLMVLLGPFQQKNILQFGLLTLIMFSLNELNQADISLVVVVCDGEWVGEMLPKGLPL